jgi:hypothetical protein
VSCRKPSSTGRRRASRCPPAGCSASFAASAERPCASACRSWFDHKTVEGILDDHAAGRAQREQEIWSLLVFELWHEQFVQQHHEPSRYSPTTLQAVAAAG